MPSGNVEGLHWESTVTRWLHALWHGEKPAGACTALPPAPLVPPIASLARASWCCLGPARTLEMIENKKQWTIDQVIDLSHAPQAASIDFQI